MFSHVEIHFAGVSAPPWAGKEKIFPASSTNLPISIPSEATLCLQMSEEMQSLSL